MMPCSLALALALMSNRDLDAAENEKPSRPNIGHQVRRRLGRPCHDRGQFHHLLAARQTVPGAASP